jgi:hypothetical protein
MDRPPESTSNVVTILARKEPQRRVALEELILGTTDRLHLEEVVGQGEHRHAAVLGGLGRARERRPQLGRAVGQEIDEVHA